MRAVLALTLLLNGCATGWVHHELTHPRTSVREPLEAWLVPADGEVEVLAVTNHGRVAHPPAFAIKHGFEIDDRVWLARFRLDPDSDELELVSAYPVGRSWLARQKKVRLELCPGPGLLPHWGPGVLPHCRHLETWLHPVEVTITEPRELPLPPRGGRALDLDSGVVTYGGRRFSLGTETGPDPGGGHAVLGALLPVTVALDAALLPVYVVGGGLLFLLARIF